MQITVSSLTTENKNMESFYTNIVKDYNKRISSLEEIVLKMFSLEQKYGNRNQVQNRIKYESRTKFSS